MRILMLLIMMVVFAYPLYEAGEAEIANGIVLGYLMSMLSEWIGDASERG